MSLNQPVGDNTLTGLLTNTFATEQLSEVFTGIKNSSLGIIIDAVDEGKAKVTTDAFYAFLENVVKLCGPNKEGTSFMFLGRSNVMEECYLYFEDKGVTAGLLELAPFSEEQAKRYIDAHVWDVSIDNEHYVSIRNLILDKLKDSFDIDNNKIEFSRFLGYAPVLDTIATLISNEKNLYNLRKSLQGDEIIDSKIIPVILQYLLDRERKEKIIPNIIETLMSGSAETEISNVANKVFHNTEQCIRLMSYTLQQPVKLEVIGDPVLDVEYNRRLMSSFFQEHPFLNGRAFRNIVFESYVIAKSLTSNNISAKELALEYLNKHKPNYYLIVFLCNLCDDLKVNSGFIPHLISASLELETRGTYVDITLDQLADDALILSIDIFNEDDKSIKLSFNIDGYQKCINLGTRLQNLSVDTPDYEIICGGSTDLFLTPPVDISAQCISINSSQINFSPNNGDIIIFDTPHFQHSLTSSIKFASMMQIFTEASVSFPFAECVRSKNIESAVDIKKILRLKKLLLLFRSHSKGSMARFRDKIEHKRVLKDSWGELLLKHLVDDKILTLRSQKFYHINPPQLSEHLNVSWDELRKGSISKEMGKYVSSIGIE